VRRRLDVEKALPALYTRFVKRPNDADEWSLTAVRQLGLPFDTTPHLVADEYLRGCRGPLPVRFARHGRARRYVLRVDREGVARVTMPRWGRRSEARRFAESQIGWIERQRVRQLQRAAYSTAVAVGAEVLLRGEPCPVVLEATADGMRVKVGDVAVRERAHAADLRADLVAALRELARRELPPRLHALAADHGLTVSGVSIRDQRTRWGSCASSGRISLNWRLVQMTAHVRDYVLLHELMHLRVRSHSARFWRHVARACPFYEEARRWLRQHGDRLL
jgi:predicted metal-dependent hydrolase